MNVLATEHILDNTMEKCIFRILMFLTQNEDIIDSGQKVIKFFFFSISPTPAGSILVFWMYCGSFHKIYYQYSRNLSGVGF